MTRNNIFLISKNNATYLHINKNNAIFTVKVSFHVLTNNYKTYFTAHADISTVSSKTVTVHSVHYRMSRISSDCKLSEDCKYKYLRDVLAPFIWGRKESMRDEHSWIRLLLYLLLSKGCMRTLSSLLPIKTTNDCHTRSVIHSSYKF